MSIAQGTTPTHYFDLPFDCGVIEAIRVTYKQEDEIVLEKELPDCSFDGNTVSVNLTQEETLGFDHNHICKIQLHCKTHDGQYLSSKVFIKSINELLSGREL